MIPNPKSQIAIEIHYAALDNVLETILILIMSGYG